MSLASVDTAAMPTESLKRSIRLLTAGDEAGGAAGHWSSAVDHGGAVDGGAAGHGGAVDAGAVDAGAFDAGAALPTWCQSLATISSRMHADEVVDKLEDDEVVDNLEHHDDEVDQDILESQDPEDGLVELSTADKKDLFLTALQEGKELTLRLSSCRNTGGRHILAGKMDISGAHQLHSVTDAYLVGLTLEGTTMLGPAEIYADNAEQQRFIEGVTVGAAGADADESAEDDEDNLEDLVGGDVDQLAEVVKDSGSD